MSKTVKLVASTTVAAVILGAAVCIPYFMKEIAASSVSVEA